MPCSCRKPHCYLTKAHHGSAGVQCRNAARHRDLYYNDNNHHHHHFTLLIGETINSGVGFEGRGFLTVRWKITESGTVSFVKSTFCMSVLFSC